MFIAIFFKYHSEQVYELLKVNEYLGGLITMARRRKPLAKKGRDDDYIIPIYSESINKGEEERS